MAASLPDSESLRRAALQASWQRGSWVARRRLWWRWAAWALLRIVLPMAAVLASMGALVRGWPFVMDSPAPLRDAPTMTRPAVAPVPVPASAASEPVDNTSLRLDGAVSARHSARTVPMPVRSPASAIAANVGDSQP